MNSKGMTGWVGVLAGIGMALGARAERPCPEGPRAWTEIPEAHYTCRVTEEWVRPVDLGGDGVADFTHERLRAVAHWGDPIWDPDRPPDAPVAYYHQDDRVEAFYPAAHVELYWLIWKPTNDRPELRLPAGHELLPEPVVSSPGPYGSWGLPEPARSWLYPRVAAEGLGIIARDVEMVPCIYRRPPFDGWCRVSYYAGFFYQSSPVWWAVDPRFDEYVGFRVRRADGWHLGWLRVKWQRVRGTPPPAPVELVSWAVHPEPDTAMVVGEPARPRLHGERGADGGLVLRWSAGWSHAVLERAASLEAPVWERVPGVTNHTVRLPAAGLRGFFRLRVE